MHQIYYLTFCFSAGSADTGIRVPRAKPQDLRTDSQAAKRRFGNAFLRSE